MGVAKQLYQLQQVDLELESNEQALKQLTLQLGESPTVLQAQAEFEMENQHLEQLRHQLHTTEWELEDIEGKTTKAEEELYSGRIKNPKELANLQHEVDNLKARRDQIEEKTLGLLDQIEAAETSATKKGSSLKELEATWHRQQQQLSVKIEQLRDIITGLTHKQQLMSAEIEPHTVEFYQDLKGKKGQAVARVAQGICHGCRISLSTTELQRVKTGNPVQCSSCGRILFLA
jgi:predicted  nucleic acid-binding Zn-ribbon protein